MVVYLLILLVLFGGLGYLVVLSSKKQAAVDYRRQQAAQQLALKMHPAYQNMVAADRAHALETERLHLDRAKQNATLFLDQQKADRDYDLARERQAFEIELERQKAAAAILLDRERFELERFIAINRVPAEGAYILNMPEGTRVTPFPSLKPANVKQIIEPQQVEQIAPATPKVFLSEVLERLPRNGLQIYYGTREDGEGFVHNLVDSTHIEEAGMTGLGKSQALLSTLYQLTQANDPSVLQLAFIDLEGETTAPFHDCPHVYQFAMKQSRHSAPQRRKAIATEPQHVEQVLDAIWAVIRRRDYTKKKRPYLLCVFEEFEDMKEALKDLPKAEQERIFSKFKRILLRGRKRGVLAYVVLQNSYTIPEVRAAQRQFQLKMTAGQPVSTAQAGGYQNLDLLKRMFAEKRKGQFLVSCTSGEFIIHIPRIDESLQKQFRQAAGYTDDDGSIDDMSIEIEAEELLTEGSIVTGSLASNDELGTGEAHQEHRALQLVKPLRAPIGEHGEHQTITGELASFDEIFTREQQRKMLQGAKAQLSLREIRRLAKIGNSSERLELMRQFLAAHGYEYQTRKPATTRDGIIATRGEA